MCITDGSRHGRHSVNTGFMLSMSISTFCLTMTNDRHQSQDACVEGNTKRTRNPIFVRPKLLDHIPRVAGLLQLSSIISLHLSTSGNIKLTGVVRQTHHLADLTNGQILSRGQFFSRFLTTVFLRTRKSPTTSHSC